MKHFFSTIIFVLFFLTVFSNGGPIDAGSFRKTGNIVLISEADVKLRKEILNIKIVGDYTEIEVFYTLENLGEAKEITYGFPIDFYKNNAYGGYWFGEGNIENFESTQNILYFYAFDNSIELKSYFWEQDSVYQIKKTEIKNDWSSNINILRRWYITKLDFQENEVKNLTVKYKIENTFRDFQWGFEYLPVYSERFFTYDLTPAKNWGDGIVDEFSLKIDYKNNYFSSFYAEFQNNMLFSYRDSVLNFNSNNFDINKNESIKINYNNSPEKYNYFIENYRILNSAINKIYSTGNNENIDYLIDENSNTCWTGKVGDSVTFEFNNISRFTDRKNLKIGAVLALNGDFSDENNFENSGKLSKANIYINDEKITSGDHNLLVYNFSPEITEYYKSYKNNFKVNSSIISQNFSRMYYDKNPNTKTLTIYFLESTNENDSISISELYFLENKTNN